MSTPHRLYSGDQIKKLRLTGHLARVGETSDAYGGIW